MTKKTLLARLRRGEDSSTEFIAKPSSFAKIGKSVCAFLNTNGGTIYIGVNGDKKVTGLTEVEIENIGELEMSLQGEITPTSLFTVTVVDVLDQSIIAIEVPMGKDQPYVFEGAIFTRKGAHTRAADANALRALVQQQVDEPERWERRLSPSMTLEELSEMEVRETANDARLGQRFNFDSYPDPLEILRKLSFWSSEGFTQGGDMLFSENPALRHPQSRVQFIHYTEDKISDDYVDHRWFDSPLAVTANELFDVLGAFVRTRSRFRESSLEREDQSVYSMAALREALVNALVHRDYAAYSGGVKVSVYPSRIEFWNSGRLPEEIKLSDLKKDHPSIPTNPDIAHVFYLRGLMERTGRGTLKIIQACKDLGAPPPKWRNEASGVTLTLFASVPDRSRHFEMNERQLTYVENSMVDSKITPAEYRDRFAPQVSSRQARRDLTYLEEYGFVRREGSGPSTKYRRLET